MFPFFPSVPNQARPAPGGNNLASQQALFENSNQANPNPQIQHQTVPGFNNQNTNFNNLIANNMAFRPLNCNQNNVDRQLMLQSGLMGMQLFLQSCMASQQNMNFNPLAAMATMQGQLCNTLQNLNHGPRPQMQGQFIMHGNFPQNVNLAASLPHGQLPSQNPMLPANNIMPQQCMPNQLKQCMQDHIGSAQAMAFSNNSMSPQPTCAGSFSNISALHPSATKEMNVVQRNAKFMDCNGGQGSTDSAAAASQNAGSSNLHHDQNLQSGRFEQGQNSGSDISNVYMGNTKRNLQIQGFYKHGQSQPRFQKLQSPHHANKKGNFRPLSVNRSRGRQHGRERSLEFPRFNQQSGGASQRSQSIRYTDQEIQQWREARKRNFPTAANIERKLAAIDGKDGTDKNALMHRRELKDVLAKQAELGVEIAELPPNYLSDAENPNGRDNQKWRSHGKSHNMKGRFKNNYNKNGRRGYENKYNKRLKPRKDDHAVPAPLHKKPTLLQKLLSADIRRDKGKLLQVFRFMTLNSFFDVWPEKPLEFPQVSAKDFITKDSIVEDGMPGVLDDVTTGVEKDSIVDGTSYLREVRGALGGHGDEDCDISSSDDQVEVHEGAYKSDDQVEVHGQTYKSEEGEITD